MSYTLHPGAEQDIEEALDFYTEQAGLAVAERFLEEFGRVVELLQVHPGLGTPTTMGRQIFPLRIFPYSVVYRDQGNSIRIVIVRHQRKKPAFGMSRR